MFIVDFTVADYLTLTGHVLVWGSLWSALAGRVELAIALAMLAMLLDAVDGKVARTLNCARPFGRYLGSFVDLINYTVCPPLVLRTMGYGSPAALAVLLGYSTCGLVRLARFNEVGNIRDEAGSLAYLGLPVFWIHFVLMALYGVRHLAGLQAFRTVTTAALPVLGFCFILDRPFWKPQNYGAITVVTVGGALLFLWLASR